MLITAMVTMSLGHLTAQNQFNMNEKQIRLRDGQVTLNYIQQGRGDVTLLFLHGWCINSHYWTDQIVHFSKSYTVYAVDLPGFGKSVAAREQWTIEEYAKDVTAFIDALGLQNVVIVGHSMSGDIMLETALLNKSKIAGLIGVDNYKFIDVAFTPEQMEEMGSFFQQLKSDFKTHAPVYSEHMLFHPTTPEEVKVRVKADISGTDPSVGFSSLMNMMEYAAGVPAKLEDLDLKLYLINSDASPTNESGLTKHCKAGYEVLSIGATGHYPMNEKPGEFNKLLQGILTQLAL